MVKPMANRAGEVLTFWEEAGPEMWYKQDDSFDRTIRDRFGALWDTAAAGECDRWAVGPRTSLALIVLLDQFPRNMFRGSALAFATDDRALLAAHLALSNGWDLRIDPPLRQFFYLPFMHSEQLTHQDRSVRLFKARMEEGDNLLHARAHREIIRRFGRFPYRNAALGRVSTPAEEVFLSGGGYAAILGELASTAA
ncbi:DUF924 family protein [Roseicyclus mahoneyensis]|jgi:uncharacterized protein (DUF924 family)|uniref:Uncharacterized protein (DUF924 family) n=1 Tax=Roseicyclus mahoneyensis TaxID=164332 RepID=A0A316GMW4_9RHOB|nr:DUF924 family protein [Roseicyclus mahoneyensis]PWK62254.1 uncharacterized protein (DUF924 family) [Roseicyclus mahoneyensis]